MSDSLIQDLLGAIDALDLDAATALFAPDAQLITLFGRQGTGTEQIRAALDELVGELRGTQHEITSEWHPEPGVCIAEFTATYQLKDFSHRGPFDRAVVVRSAGDLIRQARMYGAHELPLASSESAYREVRGPHGWLPTL